MRSAEPRTLALAGIVSLLALIAATWLLVPPIAQPLAYHDFADQRRVLGIPNFFDVASNLPFLVVGVAGVVSILGAKRGGAASLRGRGERWAWLGFFVGVGLTAFGSAWYHLDPDNARLLWDRLPMTVGFMSLFAAIVSERVSERAGRWLLGPLLVVGAASVLYWYLGEQRGAGDLRPYALVQAVPLLAIPAILALTPARYTRGPDLLVAIGWYVAAKVAEGFDDAIFAAGDLVSGHTVKHLLAGVATYWLLRMLLRREPVAEAELRGRERGPGDRLP